MSDIDLISLVHRGHQVSMSRGTYLAWDILPGIICFVLASRDKLQAGSSYPFRIVVGLQESLNSHISFTSAVIRNASMHILKIPIFRGGSAKHVSIQPWPGGRV
jgi:hypothetical protein